MIFNSSLFLFAFLPLALAFYYITPIKVRKYSLLIINFGFYAWYNIKLSLVLLLISIATYFIGMFIDKNRAKLFWCSFGVMVNLGLLIYFKYMNFFLSQANRFFSSQFTLSNIIVPLGISFIVFQSISFLIDSYRKKINKSKLIDVLLYMTFFAKISSGPITRYNDFIPSFTFNKFDLDSFEQGLFRFSIGFAKKVILSDTLGILVDDITVAQPYGISISSAWIMMLAYSLQIYLDFSGYTDMAIGIGNLFGYKLSENFNYPYISTSLGEFWRRWHISLSTWFRDYLYIPLGGSKSGNVYFNTFIVFLATGLWHGDNWTFLLWGMYHGVLLIVERLIRNTVFYNKTPKLIKWSSSMIIVAFGWLLFMSPSFNFFVDHLSKMFGFKTFSEIQMTTTFYLTNKNIFTLVISSIASLPISEFLAKHTPQKLPEIFFDSIRYIYSIGLLVISILYMINSTYSPFIYFQF